MERRFCWTRERDTRLGKKDMQQICGKLYKNISMEVIVSGAETSCSSLISLYSQISCKAVSHANLSFHALKSTTHCTYVTV